MLLQSGADVNIQGEEDGSALYIAAKKCHTEIVQLLLVHGAKYLGPISDVMASDNEENDSHSMECDSDSMTCDSDSITQNTALDD